MNRREFIRNSSGLMLGSAAFLSHSTGSRASPFPSAAGRRPNILFINTDDQAQWALGAYGNPEIHTPNMDRLAAEGMKFTRSFTCPVCSPSRAMVMTGCYNHQVGIEDWIDTAEPVGLPADVPTIAEELQRAGYRTGMVGKWHVGHTKQEFHPTSRGFDFFAGMPRGDAAMMDPVIEVNSRTVRFEGGLTDVLADFAIEFMRTYTEEPFALFFHTRRPHAPYVPVPDEDWEPYRGKKLSVPHVEGVAGERIRKITEKYYASISSVDRNLGRLLDELERLGIAGNTVVIFTGDNGYNIGHHGMLHKGNGRMLATGRTRPNIFDTSALVPQIVRYPGVVRPGSVCDELVSSIDYFPTLLEIAGAPMRSGIILEGLSMMPLLRAEESATWRDELFLIYNQHHYIPHARMRMIRTRDWKLIHHYEEDSGHELYDLKKDPGETANLCGDRSAKTIQQELERRLFLWESRTGALP
ncbi:MAG: sulfatase-like hydrolase/transferase [Gemmatimonadota bacterium]|nr:sulfatase-like hydrolase/transferase [Gemmatimonadota bacterium]